MFLKSTKFLIYIFLFIIKCLKCHLTKKKKKKPYIKHIYSNTRSHTTTHHAHFFYVHSWIEIQSLKMSVRSLLILLTHLITFKLPQVPPNTAWHYTDLRRLQNCICLFGQIHALQRVFVAFLTLHKTALKFYGLVAVVQQFVLFLISMYSWTESQHVPLYFEILCEKQFDEGRKDTEGFFFAKYNKLFKFKLLVNCKHEITNVVNDGEAKSIKLI